MNSETDPGLAARYIDAPRDPVLIALHAYWSAKRDGRPMPARLDIHPAEMKPLLPHVMLYNADAASDYSIRLVGQSIVEFIGRNFTGRAATTGMDERAAGNMRLVLGKVVEIGQPVFRAGTTYWWRDRSYREFEACFLPLSPDGRAVNIILAGVTFDTSEGF